MAREAIVGQLVVVAGLGDVPVASGAQSGGAVDRARADADRLTLRGVIKKARPALGTEASSRPLIAAGAVDPAKPTLLDQDDVLPARRRARRHVAGPAPALLAMTDQHVAQRPADLVPHRPAQTPARHHRSANAFSSAAANPIASAPVRTAA